MRTPNFWYRKPSSTFARLLAPLGFLYNHVVAARIKNNSPNQIGIPVICVGNILSGGTGKTPVVLSIAKMLQQRSIEAHLLTRGYGGNTPGPIRVDLNIHSASDVGDEALLLAELAPTWVSIDRYAGAEMAMAAGAKVIVMDDGFQNPGLQKDLALLVFDGAVGLGNGCVIPAGPLRENLKDGLKRAQASVIVGDDLTQLSNELEGTIIRAKLLPDIDVTSYKDKRLIAFAGIGRPDKFFTTVQGLDCDLVETHPFADHHSFSTSELGRLLDRAEKLNARLITTTKDAARLPGEFLESVIILPVSLVWQDEEMLDRLLDTVMN